VNERDLKRAVVRYRRRFPSSTELEIESLIAAGLSETQIEEELEQRRRKYGFNNGPQS
jgi:hypothetical protein